MAQSDSYWEDRAVEQKKKELNNVKDYEKSYAKRLSETQKLIEKELEKWYAKYAEEDGTLDPFQAKKKLTDKELSGWKQSLSEWEKMAKSGGYEHEMKLEYYKSRVSRLKALEAQLKVYMAKQTKVDEAELSKLLKNTYEDSYYKGIYESQMSFGNINYDFARLDEDELNKVLQSNWAGSNFSKRIWGSSVDKLPETLTKSLFNGIALGFDRKRLVKMARVNLQNHSIYQIHRLVITEAAHIAEQARLDSYRDSGVEKYKFVARLESHTCSTCGSLDGQVFEVDEAVSGKNHPVMHPYCRCTTAIHNERVEALRKRKNMERRRWAYGKNGEIYRVKDIDFNTWKKTANLLQDAANNEPQITQDLKEILENSNAHLTGLDYRLKTFDSLARKVKGEPDSKMRDVVRYTSISTPENQVEDYINILASLEKKGYNKSAVKNYWLNSKNPYNGINTNFISPDGYEFELQFHTQESFDLKQGELHKLYEQQRILPNGSKEWLKLQEEMTKFSGSLRKPKNIGKVT